MLPVAALHRLDESSCGDLLANPCTDKTRLLIFEGKRLDLTILLPASHRSDLVLGLFRFVCVGKNFVFHAATLQIFHVLPLKYSKYSFLCPCF